MKHITITEEDLVAIMKTTKEQFEASVAEAGDAGDIFKVE